MNDGESAKIAFVVECVDYQNVVCMADFELENPVFGT